MSDGIRDSFTPGTPYGSDYLAPPTGPMPDRSLASTPADDAPFLAGGGGSGAPKENSYSNSDDDLFPTRPLYKRPWFWLATAAGLAVVVLAVVLPVYFVVIKPDRDHHSTSSGASSTSSSGSSGDSGTSGNSGTTGSSNPQTLTTGGDGSTVTTDDGTTFTYKNPFGGYCECPSLFCPLVLVPPAFCRRSLQNGPGRVGKYGRLTALCPDGANPALCRVWRWYRRWNAFILVVTRLCETIFPYRRIIGRHGWNIWRERGRARRSA